MQLNVQGKQMDVGDSLREHAREKLEAINSKYFGRAIDADVTLAPEGHSSYKTHISVRVGKNIQVIASATEHDVYASFDHADERVAKQLRRYKKRLRDHHEHIPETPEGEIQKARDFVIAVNQNEEEEVTHEDSPLIIAESTKAIERLSVSDAVMRLDLSDAPFFMFKNAKTGYLNVVYRREDANIGWVDAS
jgi:ribosomal subunit interface protein